jgi:energy-coupling factor transporter ATP-binding protein EcfA2
MFQFPTIQKARYFTNKANGFRRAVRYQTDSSRAPEGLFTPTELHELKMLRQEVDKVELRSPQQLDNGSWQVTAQNRNTSWFADAVRSGVSMGIKNPPVRDEIALKADESALRVQVLLTEETLSTPATLSERARKYLGIG